MESYLFAIVGLGVLLLLVLAARGGGRGKSTGGLPAFQRRPALFTPAERSFLGVLDQATGPDRRVFGKIRVADLITPAPGLDRRTRRGALNRTTSKHVDFVVCDSDTLDPLLVVELDDRSHRRRDRKRRDALLDTVFRSADLPLLRVAAQKSYAVGEIRARIEGALAVRSTGRSEPFITAGPPTADAVDVEPTPTFSATGPFTAGNVASGSDNTPPLCPNCERPMRSRRVRGGAHSGKHFWACRDYPTCRGILPLAE
ncbi:MAG: DUF2726 domain-containing protein [Ectothiorhodospiraceae bacterium]|jgi:hypothetical protein